MWSFFLSSWKFRDTHCSKHTKQQKLLWTGAIHEDCLRRILTAIVWLISAILTILFPITLPQERDAAIVRGPTPELCDGAVGHAGLAVRWHVEVVRAGAGVAAAARCDQTQVRATTIVVPAWVVTCTSDWTRWESCKNDRCSCCPRVQSDTGKAQIRWD